MRAGAVGASFPDCRRVVAAGRESEPGSIRGEGNAAGQSRRAGKLPGIGAVVLRDIEIVTSGKHQFSFGCPGRVVPRHFAEPARGTGWDRHHPVG